MRKIKIIEEKGREENRIIKVYPSFQNRSNQFTIAFRHFVTHSSFFVIIIVIIIRCRIACPSCWCSWPNNDFKNNTNNKVIKNNTWRVEKRDEKN